MPSAAFELLGICLFGTCRQDDDQGLIAPKPYTATLEVLTDGSPDPELEKAVRNASLVWQERDKPAAGSAGLLTRAKADYRRILAALYIEARYDAEISISWNGREIADLPAGTELPDSAQLTITVRAGPPFRFGRTEIVNRAPVATTRRDRVADPAGEGFLTGAPARATAVNKAGRLATDAWRQQGYAKARVASRKVTADHNAGELNVTLEIEPGERASYGPVTVKGTERMRPSFVARQTGLAAGAEYDPDDLKRAEQRLQRLGVFSSVSLKEADRIGPDGALPFTLTVRESKLRRIGMGATVSTVDGAGLEGFWLHRNLFGRAERLRFDGRISGIGSTASFDEFDYFLGSELTLPGRFTPDTDIVIGGFFEREVLDLYSKNRGSTSVYANHFFSDELTGRIGTFVTYGEYDDVFGVRRFGVAGLEAGIEYDTRDSKLDPTSGFHARFTGKPFYEWEFGNAVGKLEAELRAYHALGAEERTVLAARLKAGTIFGASLSQIPQDELFLAGGGTSVRGYAYRGIGVDVSGGTSGGRSLLEASAEIRQDITDTIGIVGFADIGHVNNGSIPDFSGDIRIGAGIGLRYNTGLGPLRLDAAVPLNRQSGDPAFGIYAGIGQAF
ncbi:autotransporter assembly complex protein TamA [Oricola thermophila]|nr:autotransporter assembly complex family protein [Oricola thermophila]